MKIIVVVATLAALGWASYLLLNRLLIQEPAQTGSRPDVMIILVDALRRDHLGLYGYDLATSPFLDEWSRSGVVFRNAIAPSTWTKPSVASLFTGFYPAAHGVYGHPGRGKRDKTTINPETDILPASMLTMAEIFKKAGYQTGMFTSNSWLNEVFGFDQGFETAKVSSFKAASAETLTGQALSWISRLPENAGASEAPFFLYLHLMDVHGPYNPPGIYRDMFKSEYKARPPKILTPSQIKKLEYLYNGSNDLNEYMARYDGGVRYVDDQIAAFFRKLRENRLDDNLIIVFMSDHGEGFYEHGLPNHGNSLYSELARVPLVFRWDNNISPGVVDNTVESIGVMPALLELCGIAPPEGEQGKSFAKLLRQEKGIEENDAWLEVEHPDRRLFGLVRNGVKYIFDMDSKKIIEVYNLTNDPGEKHNVKKDMAPDKLTDIGREIIKRKNYLMSKKPPRDAGGNRKMPESTRKDLEALGYIQ